MKNIIFFTLSSILFFSCASVHLPIPGEAEIKKNNIYTEYMSIADAYFDLGKYEKAVTYYNYAMQHKTLRWSAYYKMGKSYAMNKDWDSAEKVYSTLLKRDPENINIQMSLAYIYAMNGTLDKSAELYEKLLLNNSENSDILVNYINILFAREKYEKAREQLQILKDKFKDNSNISVFEKKLSELDEVPEDKKE